MTSRRWKGPAPLPSAQRIGHHLFTTVKSRATDLEIPLQRLDSFTPLTLQHGFQDLIQGLPLKLLGRPN